MFNFSLKLQCFTFFCLTIWLRLIDNFRSYVWMEMKFVSINSLAYPGPKKLLPCLSSRSSEELFFVVSNPLISNTCCFSYWQMTITCTVAAFRWKFQIKGSATLEVLHAARRDNRHIIAEKLLKRKRASWITKV